MLLGGRGVGKTRTCSEHIVHAARHNPGIRIAIVAETTADARDVVAKGHTGILTRSPPWDRPVYKPSQRSIEWKNGSICHLFSAEKPGQLRGPQFHLAWLDEFAKFRKALAVWDQIEFSTRLGTNPRIMISTTPRPIKILRKIINDKGTITTRSRTIENADNLSSVFMDRIIEKYKGTRMGRQELDAEILDEVEGSIVNPEMILRSRLPEFTDKTNSEPTWQTLDLIRTVVAIDPAVTSSKRSDSTGIIVAGVTRDSHYYIIDDLTTKGTPEEWANIAATAYNKYYCDCIVAEVNQGGDMIASVIGNVSKDIPVRKVRASKGKHIRFEPVGMLYEQGKVHHVGSFPDLEDQICGFTPFGYELDGSPDNCDAMVWAISRLIGGGLLVYTGESMDLSEDQFRGVSHWKSV